jgi:hypothetical protein
MQQVAALFFAGVIAVQALALLVEPAVMLWRWLRRRRHEAPPVRHDLAIAPRRPPPPPPAATFGSLLRRHVLPEARAMTLHRANDNWA